jgi:hypothetical protein
MRLVAHEDRSVLGMAPRLIAEGLRARGIDWGAVRLDNLSELPNN